MDVKNMRGFHEINDKTMALIKDEGMKVQVFEWFRLYAIDKGLSMITLTHKGDEIAIVYSDISEFKEPETKSLVDLFGGSVIADEPCAGR